MCRLAAYFGPEVPLSTLVYDAPHSLERQAYVPRELVSGNVNVDGTGVAWWLDGGEDPLVYVSERPPWSEHNLPRLAPRLRGAPQLAVVRSQTAGIPSGAGSAHPFVYDRWAGAHNGFIEGFGDLKWPLAEMLADAVRARLDVFSDSLLLFLLVMSELGRAGDDDPGAAMTAVARRVVALREHRAVSLNLVVAGAAEIVALRCARGVEPNSLYRIEGGERWPGARLLASEALDDDPAWQPVDADHLVHISEQGIRSTAVDI